MTKNSNQGVGSCLKYNLCCCGGCASAESRWLLFLDSVIASYMRVFSPGIRTVPVLSVAKKPAAPRPTSTSTGPAAKCALIRQDEPVWLSIGCWNTFVLWLKSSSLLEVITGREELIEYSKLTCFAKRMLNMVRGGGEQWDRRSVSAAVKHMVHHRCFLLLRNLLHRGRRRRRQGRLRSAHWSGRMNRFDCRLGAEILLSCCWSLLLFLEVITGREELIEYSKLTCFAKRMLNMVRGGGEQWDRRSVSAAVKHR